MTKIAIVGAGRVGAACALALVARGSAREIVIVDRTRERARAVVADLRSGAPLCTEVSLLAGDYVDLAGAAVVLVTAGVNEKRGGATDRSDPQGRLRLLDTNAAVYNELVPRIVEAAPDATIVVVTDPPDPLADVARRLAGHPRVLSTGTLLDSLRFRTQLALRLKVSPASVDALVVGEHGTSQVFLWSTARLGGTPIANALPEGMSMNEFRERVEHDVRFANIAIIEGNDASQFGIGIVSARIAEVVLRDERAILPVGAYNTKYGVTLSLPSVVGRQGAICILEPAMSADEQRAFRASAEVLRNVAQRV
jgi:L-lactate dehydrogenase